MQSGTRESSFWKQNKLSISKKKFLAREVAKLVVLLYLQEFEGGTVGWIAVLILKYKPLGYA